MLTSTASVNGLVFHADFPIGNKLKNALNKGRYQRALTQFDSRTGFDPRAESNVGCCRNLLRISTGRPRPLRRAIHFVACEDNLT